ncbi:uncharacterized protein [Henckelia pumila]|uniref:uncharacterized protein n=1 Tax=Henckelia pumila TaxID=405737 RepID=UPI003C6E0131
MLSNMFCRFLPAKNGASTFIQKLFRRQIFPGGYSWRYVTEPHRDFYWDQFVHTLSLRQRGNVPRTIDQAIWATYLAHWETEEWQKLSRTYGNNRRSEPAGPGTGPAKHIAGSRPYAVHAASLRQELNRDPNSYELHLKTHRRQNGTFVDSKSQQISEEVERRIIESFPLSHTGEEQHCPTADEVNAIYFDVVGGVSHRRIYGIGSTAQTIFSEEMTPRPRGCSQMKMTMASQNEAIQAARSDARAAREETQAAREKTQQLRAAHERTQVRLSNTQRRMSKMEMMMASICTAINMKKKQPTESTRAATSSVPSYSLRIQEPTQPDHEDGDDDDDDDDETQPPSDWSQFLQ